ncbi:MAG: hypothetical protein Q9208_008716 [Pyrenodesmia sp. 3 TL-2023]
MTLTSLATSIPNSTEASRARPSGSNKTSAIDLLTSKPGVDPSQHPDWAGVMHPSDCAKARYYFNGRVAMYDPIKPMTFWSRRWTVRPPGDEFELPFGTKHKTCTLLVRMAKDFGDDVLPIILPDEGSGFSDESDAFPAAEFDWEDILDSIDGLQALTAYIEQPSWMHGLSAGAQEAVVMFIPSSSIMSRRWAADMRAGFGDILVGVNGVIGSVE